MTLPLVKSLGDYRQAQVDPFAAQLALSRVHALLVPMRRLPGGYGIDPCAENWSEPYAGRGLAAYGLGRALRMLLDVLGGLTALHDTLTSSGQTFTHGDVVPAHLRIDPGGVSRLLPLSPRHSAIAEGAEQELAPDSVGHLSPERLLGHTLDPRADVFSGGVLLWEALAGRRLFEESSAEVIVERVMLGKAPMPQLPPELVWAIPLKMVAARALCAAPQHRFAGSAELATAIAIVARERVASHADVASFFGISTANRSSAQLSAFGQRRVPSSTLAPLGPAKASRETALAASDRAAASPLRAESVLPESDAALSRRDTTRMRALEAQLASIRETLPDVGEDELELPPGVTPLDASDDTVFDDAEYESPSSGRSPPRFERQPGNLAPAARPSTILPPRPTAHCSPFSRLLVPAREAPPSALVAVVREPASSRMPAPSATPVAEAPRSRRPPPLPSWAAAPGSGEPLPAFPSLPPRAEPIIVEAPSTLAPVSSDPHAVPALQPGDVRAPRQSRARYLFGAVAALGATAAIAIAAIVNSEVEPVVSSVVVAAPQSIESAPSEVTRLTLPVALVAAATPAPASTAVAPAPHAAASSRAAVESKRALPPAPAKAAPAVSAKDYGL